MQEIELNKQHWSSLFEQYMFFEAYKNYLQVDIVAGDAEDLLAWKGWVESRFRQLTLKVDSLLCSFDFTAINLLYLQCLFIFVLVENKKLLNGSRFCLFSFNNADRKRH